MARPGSSPTRPRRGAGCLGGLPDGYRALDCDESDAFKVLGLVKEKKRSARRRPPSPCG